MQAIWKIDCLQTFHFPKCLMKLCNTIKIHEKIKSEVCTDHWLPSFSKSSKILLWIRDPGVGFRDLQVHVKLVKHLVWVPSPKLNTSELVQKHDFTEMINIHIHNFTPHRPNFTQNLKPTENRERERHTKI